MTSLAPSRDGSHDFVFQTGQWRIRNRRLVKRLAGCTDWEDFEATLVARLLPGGLGNTDEYLTFAPRADAAPIQLSSCQTLSTEGAYVVTQDLSNPSGGCLVLEADRITIGLNGFSVSGAEGGITSAGNATRRFTVIRNGRVGFINLPTAEGTVVERVRASGTVWAILLGSEALVRDCVAVDAAGISVGPGPESRYAPRTPGSTVLRRSACPAAEFQLGTPTCAVAGGSSPEPG